MAEAEKEGDKKKKAGGFPLKTLGVLLAVMLLEGGLIAGAFFFAMMPPVPAAGAGLNSDEKQQLEKPVQLLLVEQRYQNARDGRVSFYDTEIYISVKMKHREAVEPKLKEQDAAIRSELRKIFSQAEPTHLLEPPLTTIRRQIRGMLEEKLGRTEEGESYVDEVLITKCMKFRQ